jgi:hypothetical protein
MEKEFVPYELASRMKQLGFDEPCFAWYDGRYTSSINKDYCKNSEEWLNTIHCAAPLFQQAFRWFRESYNLFCEINVDKTTEPKFAFTIKEYESAQFLEGFGEDVLSEYLYYKHEDAELACLEKLIEIVERK